MKIQLGGMATAVVVGAAAFSLSSCGFGQLGGSRPADHDAAAAFPDPSRTVAPRTVSDPPRHPLATPPASEPALRARVVAGHGTLVVDAEGFTMYRSDLDVAHPSQSHCIGPCTRTWRPVLATGADIRVFGIDPSIVHTTVRPDGHRQLTIAGWPVYRFVGDHRAGDVAGQCKGGFFAITPEGQKSM